MVTNESQQSSGGDLLSWPSAARGRSETDYAATAAGAGGPAASMAAASSRMSPPMANMMGCAGMWLGGGMHQMSGGCLWSFPLLYISAFQQQQQQQQQQMQQQQQPSLTDVVQSLTDVVKSGHSASAADAAASVKAAKAAVLAAAAAIAEVAAKNVSGAPRGACVKEALPPSQGGVILSVEETASKRFRAAFWRTVQKASAVIERLAVGPDRAKYEQAVDDGGRFQNTFELEGDNALRMEVQRTYKSCCKSRGGEGVEVPGLAHCDLEVRAARKSIHADTIVGYRAICHVIEISGSWAPSRKEAEEAAEALLRAYQSGGSEAARVKQQELLGTVGSVARTTGRPLSSASMDASNDSGTASRGGQEQASGSSREPEEYLTPGRSKRKDYDFQDFGDEEAPLASSKAGPVKPPPSIVGQTRKDSQGGKVTATGGGTNAYSRAVARRYAAISAKAAAEASSRGEWLGGEGVVLKDIVTTITIPRGASSRGEAELSSAVVAPRSASSTLMRSTVNGDYDTTSSGRCGCFVAGSDTKALGSAALGALLGASRRLSLPRSVSSLEEATATASSSSLSATAAASEETWPALSSFSTPSCFSSVLSSSSSSSSTTTTTLCKTATTRAIGSGRQVVVRVGAKAASRAIAKGAASCTSTSTLASVSKAVSAIHQAETSLARKRPPLPPPPPEASPVKRATTVGGEAAGEGGAVKGYAVLSAEGGERKIIRAASGVSGAKSGGGEGGGGGAKGGGGGGGGGGANGACKTAGKTQGAGKSKGKERGVYREREGEGQGGGTRAKDRKTAQGDCGGGQAGKTWESFAEVGDVWKLL